MLTSTISSMLPLLVVDDDPGNFRELLRRWLQPHGYEVQFASDCRGGAYRRRGASICCRGGGCSYAGCQRALASGAVGSGLCDGGCVGDRDSTIAPESLRKGIVAYILKPFERDRFVAVVAQGARRVRKYKS